MKSQSMRRVGLGVLSCIGVLSLLTTAGAEPRTLAPGPSPANNPLKGLVPYSTQDHKERFPHSLEFNYVALGALMTGPNSFDWSPLERLLDDVAGRGHQLVLRVFLEYPDREDGIPAFLARAGVKIHRRRNDYGDGGSKKLLLTPDYNDARVREALVRFIGEFGRKYDDDARLAYVTAGLLGTWGEWHAWPRDELWAGKPTQRDVLTAYAAAFRKTPVLLRYPAGGGNDRYESNVEFPFGYHDDSFAWGTLDTGRRGDAWFYMPLLKQAGPLALEKWRTQPIGGEIRPELWGRIFDERVGVKEAQDFAECVRQTHVSWLMDTGMFESAPSRDRSDRAVAHVQKMGYDFHVPTVELKLSDSQCEVRATVVNQGVAPFYREWPLELGAIDAKGNVVRRWPVPWSLTKLLPGDTPREWTHRVDAANLPGDTLQLAVRVVSPLKNGLALRFANADQDRHADGWLSLGQLPR